MRRSLLFLILVGASAVAVVPAQAQLKYGVQGSVMTGLDDVTIGTDLNGTFGIGPRVALQPPLLPIGVVGQGVYYFPDCGGGDCSYLTYSLAAQLRLPMPIVNPYAIGGWQWRRSGNGETHTESGAMLGVGVQLNLGVSIFLEGTFEFNDEIPEAPDFDNDPIVIKGGILLG